MSIDLDTSEGRKQYLSEKLDDLLDGINDSYGTVLMEELLTRLELTIKDFNDEMKTLCDQLVKKQKERQHLLELLRSRDEMSSKIVDRKVLKSSDDTLLNISSEIPNQAEYPQFAEAEEDIPSWEKKLSKLGKK